MIVFLLDREAFGQESIVEPEEGEEYDEEAAEDVEDELVEEPEPEDAFAVLGLF